MTFEERIATGNEIIRQSKETIRQGKILLARLANKSKTFKN